MSKKVTKTTETIIGTTKREVRPSENVIQKTSVTMAPVTMAPVSMLPSSPSLGPCFVPSAPMKNSTLSKKRQQPSESDLVLDKEPGQQPGPRRLDQERGTSSVSLNESRHIEIIEKSSEVRLSPLRTRLKEKMDRIESSTDKPMVITKVKEKKPKEPKKEKESKPVVYKSPTWYKSPRVKLIKPENVVLKELLRKDPRYTEREVEKIVSDHS
jgi:hypothetical protein